MAKKLLGNWSFSKTLSPRGKYTCLRFNFPFIVGEKGLQCRARVHPCHCNPLVAVVSTRASYFVKYVHTYVFHRYFKRKHSYPRVFFPPFFSFKFKNLKNININQYKYRDESDVWWNPAGEINRLFLVPKSFTHDEIPKWY